MAHHVHVKYFQKRLIRGYEKIRHPWSIVLKSVYVCLSEALSPPERPRVRGRDPRFNFYNLLQCISMCEMKLSEYHFDVRTVRSATFGILLFGVLLLYFNVWNEIEWVPFISEYYLDVSTVWSTNFWSSSTTIFQRVVWNWVVPFLSSTVWMRFVLQRLYTLRYYA